MKDAPEVGPWLAAVRADPEAYRLARYGPYLTDERTAATPAHIYHRQYRGCSLSLPLWRYIEQVCQLEPIANIVTRLLRKTQLLSQTESDVVGLAGDRGGKQRTNPFRNQHIANVVTRLMAYGCGIAPATHNVIAERATT